MIGCFAGAFTSLQFESNRSLKRCEFCISLAQGRSGECLRGNDETGCLVYPVESHVSEEDDGRSLGICSRACIE